MTEEKKKVKKSRQKDPPRGGECGTRGSDVWEENLLPSLLCTLPKFNILFKFFSYFFSWAGGKLTKARASLLLRKKRERWCWGRLQIAHVPAFKPSSYETQCPRCATPWPNGQGDLTSHWLIQIWGGHRLRWPLLQNIPGNQAAKLRVSPFPIQSPCFAVEVARGGTWSIKRDLLLSIDLWGHREFIAVPPATGQPLHLLQSAAEPLLQGHGERRVLCDFKEAVKRERRCPLSGCSATAIPLSPFTSPFT